MSVLDDRRLAGLSLTACSYALMLVAMSDHEGRIYTGGKPLVAFVAGRRGATRGDRRLMERELPELFRVGYLSDQGDHVLVVSQEQRSHHEPTTTEQRQSNEATTNRQRTGNEPATKSELSPRIHVAAPPLSPTPPLPEQKKKESSERTRAHAHTRETSPQPSLQLSLPTSAPTPSPVVNSRPATAPAAPENQAPATVVATTPDARPAEAPERSGVVRCATVEPAPEEHSHRRPLADAMLAAFYGSTVVDHRATPAVVLDFVDACRALDVAPQELRVLNEYLLSNRQAWAWTRRTRLDLSWFLGGARGRGSNLTEQMAKAREWHETHAIIAKREAEQRAHDRRGVEAAIAASAGVDPVRSAQRAREGAAMLRAARAAELAERERGAA